MDFLSNVMEAFLDWVRALWPGFASAVVGASLGWSLMAFPGLVAGAAAGAIAGTVAGHKLGLITVRRITGSVRNDRLLYSGAAFLLVVLGYMLFQVAIVIATLLALATIAAFFMTG